jgi:isoleucyl-tRNA synthetase
MLQNLENFSLPEIEEKVLKFWREKGVFEKNLRLAEKSRPKNGKTRKKFVFYEGPPTANARPGIHHVLARAFKDIVLRYKTMAGFNVPRKGGWDTHGLPVELEVEKSLGLKTKKDIEKYGIAEFNKKCKESVWKYKDEWERLTERIGFWLDLKNPYITYENKYIETLWWIIKEVWKKKLLYKGHKVVPWCTRCGTALSSHEIALGYREVEEKSVYLKFKLTTHNSQLTSGKEPTYILSWTTTPWTLPGNVALAINPEAKYVKVKYRLSDAKSSEFYVLAKERLSVLAEPYEIIEEFKGEKLIGLSYEPLFNVESLKHKNSYKIYPADFVTMTDGTGVVHTAVMYGEDDYNLGKKVGLPQYHTVDEQGKFTKDVPGLAGMYVKDKKTEDKIIQHLITQNSLLKTELYTHEYPFCWRCSTPLLYYARDSWFIGMSKLRRKLVAANKKINWIPSHIKEGRFGNWLKEIKDWAISRERYWGTPLPIWVCKKCEFVSVVGSVKELSTTQGSSKNRYIFMRHGESVSNLEDIINSDPKDLDKYNLTLKGRLEVEKTAKKLKKEKIDIIISSDFRRARETADIVAAVLGVKDLKFDPRLREVNTGKFNGFSPKDYHNFFASTLEKFTKRPPEGETLEELGGRVFSLVSDLENSYRDKTILLVSHEYPIWMAESVLRGWSEEESAREKERRGGDFIRTAEAVEVPFFFTPRNEWGFGDLHRPYIDKIVFVCKKCGGEMKRIPEVADVWFDSGAMPFAQAHKEIRPPKIDSNVRRSNLQKIDYPADYIAEGVDQTRGWFYTLLAVATLLGKGAPYKNVISLGLVLDKNGQKMSKSKGNTVDPWAMVEKYGADAARWYFYTINSPGEPKKFDEIELGKTFRRFFLLLYNSYVFLKTYARRNSKFDPPAGGRNSKLSNILDRWILSRLHETINLVTAHLEKYEVGEAGRRIEELVEDLSRWYIRRSRRRFQPERNTGRREELRDYENASVVLGYVIITVSKLIAPFTPFFAEALYQSLRGSIEVGKMIDADSSVHLTDWPKAEKNFIDKKLLAAMKEVRLLASLVLAKRAEIGIKVRQPLALLKIKDNKKSKIKNNKELLNILKDEINVKEIVFDPKLEDDLWLDTVITHELKEEGLLREMVRLVQGLRQDGGFRPKDKLILALEAPEELRYILQKYEKNFSKEVNVVVVEYKRSEKFDIELETKIDDWPVWLSLRKPL